VITESKAHAKADLVNFSAAPQFLPDTTPFRPGADTTDEVHLANAKIILLN